MYSYVIFNKLIVSFDNNAYYLYINAFLIVEKVHMPFVEMNSKQNFIKSHFLISNQHRSVL